MGNSSSISATQSVYFPNEPIEISYNIDKSDEYKPGSCWIGLIPLSVDSNDEVINDQHDVDYFYVHNARSGKGILRTCKIGVYAIKCFANDNGGVLITQQKSNPIYISYIKTKNNRLSFNENENIEVLYDFTSFNNIPEPIRYNNSNWIGIIPSKIKNRNEITNDKHDTNYFRISNKKGSNSMIAKRGNQNVDDFSYELRMFPRDDGGTQIGVGIPIQIISSLDDQMRKLYEDAHEQISKCAQLGKLLVDLQYTNYEAVINAMDCLEKIGTNLDKISNKCKQIDENINKRLQQYNDEIQKSQIALQAENKSIELNQKYLFLRSQFNQSQWTAITASRKLVS